MSGIEVDYINRLAQKMMALREEKSRLASQKATTRAKAMAEFCRVLDAYGVPWEVFQWERLT